MRKEADQPAASRRSAFGSAAFYVLTAAAVVLAWQVAVQPLAQRAPPTLAIRLSPGSPEVLSRAAEGELAAGRNDNAAHLARAALAKAPFSTRALRIIGLTEAGAGQRSQADQILTLAGNWSLRDDPAHAWLLEHRLRNGDYASAFAHADTLVRRRQDIQPQVFKLFTAAGSEDPQRSLPVIAGLLAAEPPWRPAYFSSLAQTPEGLGVEMNLAVLLEAGDAPLSNTELQAMYRALLKHRQIEAIRAVRTGLNRPPTGVAVTNGGFADEAAPEPFQWRFERKGGVAAEIVLDDLRETNPALRVDYDGYASALIVEQLLILGPGSYQFSAETRTESGDPTGRLAWTLTCAVGGRSVASVRAPEAAADNAWRPISSAFQVPEGCPAQWLRLETIAGDRRSPTVAWFDRIKISPENGPQAASNTRARPGASG